MAELGPSRSFYFHYEAAGEMAGYTYQPASGTSTECLFVKNLQGDVERVISDTGTLLASYTYDAWGNLCQSSGSLANINPIRYRSYYYDPETGLYYLQSRYYDPQIGRFVNADGLVDFSSGNIGSNLYAYCNNAPIMHSDSSGHMVDTIYDLVSAGYSFAAVIKNPGNSGNWLILILDIADICIPVVGGPVGFGEAVHAASVVATGTKLYKDLSSKNFRYNLQQFTGVDGKGMDAHHVFPQKFDSFFTSIGIEIHRPEYGVWINKEIHSQFSYDYNQDWYNFIYGDETVRPTKVECFSFAKDLARKYGYQFK